MKNKTRYDFYVSKIKRAYDVPTYNPEEERQIELHEKVDKWWYDLDDNYKFELIESYYPDDAYRIN